LGKVGAKTIAGFIAAAILLTAGVFLWTQYGEYDKRDLPSSLLIRAKTFDGYHVHAHVSYDYSREIFLCNGFGGHGYDEANFNDISLDGVHVSIKRKWPGICRPEYELTTISCNEDSVWSLSGKQGVKIWLSADPSDELAGKRIEIGKNEKSSWITHGGFKYEDDQSFKINKSTAEIEIVCGNSLGN
jgi:hypothetical protein